MPRISLSAPFLFVPLLSVLLASLLATPGMASPPPAQAMNQQAQQAMRRPTRVDVLALEKTNQTDHPVRLQVTLRGGDGQPVPALDTVSADVQITLPSGQTSTRALTFSPGESQKEIDIPISEAGLVKLSVRQPDDRLLGSSDYVYVAPLPKPKAAKKKATRKQSHLVVPLASPRLRFAAEPRVFPARLMTAAYTMLPQAGGADAPPAQPGAPAADASLQLKISGVDSPDGIPADGKTAARVQLFWIAPDPPKQDVQVWLNWSNGDLSPNPVLIPNGQRTGEAEWTSRYPIPSATLSVAATIPPHLQFQGNNQATARFGEVFALDFAKPSDPSHIGPDPAQPADPRYAGPPIVLTIVDTFDLTAMFFDSVGNPTRIPSQRSVVFVASSPILSLKPAQVDGDFRFSTTVVPTYIGQSNIEALSPGYHSLLYEVRVTYLSVLLFCLAGGVMGALLSYMNSKGNLLVRIASGVIVGLVASWAYVFVGLPNIQAALLHSRLSVLFVSLLASFGGVKVLSVISGKLNLGF